MPLETPAIERIEVVSDDGRTFVITHDQSSTRDNCQTECGLEAEKLQEGSFRVLADGDWIAVRRIV